MNHLRELADDLRGLSEVTPTSSPEDAELFDRAARRVEEIIRGRVRADLMEGRLEMHAHARQSPIDGDALDDVSCPPVTEEDVAPVTRCTNEPYFDRSVDFDTDEDEDLQLRLHIEKALALMAEGYRSQARMCLEDALR